MRQRLARAALALIVGALAISGGTTVGAAVREHVLTDRCLDAGKVPLWQSSDPATDHRPNGLLPFHCLTAEEATP